MKTFAEFVEHLDHMGEKDSDFDNYSALEKSHENSDCLNDVIEMAVKKGHKKKIVSFLKGLGDEEINIKLDDDDQGLGDIKGSNTRETGPPDDEIVPASVDVSSPGLDGDQ